MSWERNTLIKVDANWESVVAVSPDTSGGFI